MRDREYFLWTRGGSRVCAQVRARDVQTKSIKLWALRCGNCGRIEILWNGKRLGRIDLHARNCHSQVGVGTDIAV